MNRRLFGARAIFVGITLGAACLLATTGAAEPLGATNWKANVPASASSTAEPDTNLQLTEAAATPTDTAPPTGTASALEGEDKPIDINAIKLRRLYQIIDSLPPREKVPVTLLDCVQVVLRNNQDIQLATYAPLKAEADIFASKGEFDPVLKGDAQYTRASQSVGSDVLTYTGGGITSVEAFNTNSTAQVAGKLPWGTQYQASFKMTHEETTYNKFFEQYNGGLTLSFSQPLLRGFGPSYNLTRIRIAKNAKAGAEDTLRAQVMKSVGDVVKAYWDLVLANENVSVRRESLANAERLLDINQKRFNIGVGAALDVVQAEAGVATRQSDYIAAISQVRDAEDRLKDLMNAEKNPGLWTKQIVPLDEPSLREATLDEENSVKLAIENRPEILQAVVAIENAKLQAKRTGMDMQPQFDVMGSAYSGGRNHYLSKIFDDVLDTKDYAYSYGLQGSVSLGNRAARGAYQRANLEAREAEDRLARTKQQLVLNVRLALRGVETSHTLVESTHQARMLQETNVLAGEKRLKLGVTTSFEVLRTQEDLAVARTQEIQALVNYEKSLTDLYQAEGILLQNLGVSFEGVQPEKPIGYIRSVMPIPVE